MHRFLFALILSVIGFGSVFSAGCADEARGKDSTKVEQTSTQFSWQLPNQLTFCGENVPLNIPEVKERAEREFYLNLQSPGQITLYLKRSGRYFSMYDRVFKEKGLPSDLKFVSVAESALFMARSSKDAVGLWQFIPATARAMGLLVNEHVDERRHPEKSTYAAARYLKSGRDANGSWTNAAAGYNMGHENFAENQRYQKARDFYSLYLNEETSRYVLRIAVLKHIIENAEQYGIPIPESSKYKDPAYTVVEERNPIPNLAEWAVEHGSTYKDVKILNPWILSRTLPSPPNGQPWQIYVPK